MPSEGGGGQGKKSLSPLFVNLLAPKYGESEGMLVNSRSAAHPDAGVRTCGKPASRCTGRAGCGRVGSTAAALTYNIWRILFFPSNYRGRLTVRATVCGQVERLVFDFVALVCMWCLPQVGPLSGPGLHEKAVFVEQHMLANALACAGRKRLFFFSPCSLSDVLLKDLAPFMACGGAQGPARAKGAFC